MLLDIHEPGETPTPHETDSVAVGIDLGTTNSLVAVSSAGKPEVMRNIHGEALIPSIVAYDADEVVVGYPAREWMSDRPEMVVSSIKRLMGRGLDDIKTLAGTLPFDFDANAEGMVRLKLDGRKLTPVEVSAEILRALKQRAETSLEREVSQAVVTVPAYFDDAARTATKDAARLAGLDVLRLLNEPTAAALAYGLDKGSEGLYAIYDLGGGTFDVSILRMEKGVFQVLATGGDAALGGDDFDHAIAERFLAERAQDIGTHETTSVEAKLSLEIARAAKEHLTQQDNGTWPLGASDKQTIHTLDVATLDALIAPLVDRTIEICVSVVDDAGLDIDEIAGIVLVGGSTRVPQVRRKVAACFGREPLADIDPDEVVALGAALQAEALTVGADTLLLDVTPLSLGLETMGGVVEKVIYRNTPIPVAMAQEFTTYQDGQAAMLIHVVQGEREMVDQNRSLARFVLHDIPPLTAGAARIQVKFALDADGILTVSANEQSTGVEQRIEVKPSYGLSDEEMETMLRDSMKHARQDMETRMLTESRVEAKRNVLALRAALDADGDLLRPIERRSVENAVAGLEKAMATSDRDLIEGWIEKLDDETQFFAERRMDRGIRDALEGVAVDDLEKKVGSGADSSAA